MGNRRISTNNTNDGDSNSNPTIVTTPQIPPDLTINNHLTSDPNSNHTNNAPASLTTSNAFQTRNHSNYKFSNPSNTEIPSNHNKHREHSQITPNGQAISHQPFDGALERKLAVERQEGESHAPNGTPSTEQFPKTTVSNPNQPQLPNPNNIRLQPPTNPNKFANPLQTAARFANLNISTLNPVPSSNSNNLQNNINNNPHLFPTQNQQTSTNHTITNSNQPQSSTSSTKSKEPTDSDQKQNEISNHLNPESNRASNRRETTTTSTPSTGQGPDIKGLHKKYIIPHQNGFTFRSIPISKLSDCDLKIMKDDYYRSIPLTTTTIFHKAVFGTLALNRIYAANPRFANIFTIDFEQYNRDYLNNRGGDPSAQEILGSSKWEVRFSKGPLRGRNAARYSAFHIMWLIWMITKAQTIFVAKNANRSALGTFILVITKLFDAIIPESAGFQDNTHSMSEFVTSACARIENVDTAQFMETQGSYQTIQQFDYRHFFKNPSLSYLVATLRSHKGETVPESLSFNADETDEDEIQTLNQDGTNHGFSLTTNDKRLLQDQQASNPPSNKAEAIQNNIEVQQQPPPKPPLPEQQQPNSTTNSLNHYEEVMNLMIENTQNPQQRLVSSQYYFDATSQNLSNLLHTLEAWWFNSEGAPVAASKAIKLQLFAQNLIIFKFDSARKIIFNFYGFGNLHKVQLSIQHLFEALLGVTNHPELIKYKACNQVLELARIALLKHHIIDQREKVIAFDLWHCNLTDPDRQIPQQIIDTFRDEAHYLARKHSLPQQLPNSKRRKTNNHQSRNDGFLNEVSLNIQSEQPTVSKNNSSCSRNIRISHLPQNTANAQNHNHSQTYSNNFTQQITPSPLSSNQYTNHPQSASMHRANTDSSRIPTSSNNPTNSQQQNNQQYAPFPYNSNNPSSDHLNQHLFQRPLSHPAPIPTIPIQDDLKLRITELEKAMKSAQTTYNKKSDDYLVLMDESKTALQKLEEISRYDLLDIVAVTAHKKRSLIQKLINSVSDTEDSTSDNILKLRKIVNEGLTNKNQENQGNSALDSLLNGLFTFYISLFPSLDLHSLIFHICSVNILS